MWWLYGQETVARIWSGARREFSVQAGVTFEYESNRVPCHR
jgi:hypothetical protein